MPGTLVISNISDGTNSTSATDPIRGSAKAWVNFNGSTATIRTSYNVSSVTRNTTGDYTVNFTNALADANYSAVYGGASSASNMGRYISSITASAYRFVCCNTNNAGSVDDTQAHVAFFR